MPEDLCLVPRPRHIELGGPGPRTDCEVTQRRDAAIAAEGFEIQIGEHGVDIRYADDNGLRYARSLLDQIRLQSTDRLPQLEVRDHPDFPVRGYMLDVSRDRVPTRATLERLVEIMALARINQFQLYTEHTFAYRDHEVVWRDASPITHEDVAWLGELCAARGIELVPNQNCLGHMNRWLYHDAYRHRAERPDDPIPWSVAPTPENAAFVLELFDELLPNFASRRVNVDGDEPFDLGQGASEAEVERRGRTAVYLEYMDRITRPLVERGYEVLVWNDVMREDAKRASDVLADGVVPLSWHYERIWSDEDARRLPPEVIEWTSRLGVELTRSAFAREGQALADAGMPFWVAPGTSTWNSLIGRVDNAYGNLLEAAETGLQLGARGYLVTDWGDNGHHQPPTVSFGPLIYGGAVSWSLEANRDLDVAAVLDRFVFEDANGVLGSTLDAFGRVWRSTGQLAVNSSPIFSALVRAQTGWFGDPDAAKCAETVDALDQAVANIEHSTPGCSDGAAVGAELTAAARLARHGVWRILRKTDGPAPDDATLREDLREAIAMQREAWLMRSRPGGLSDSIARLETTLASYGT